MSQCRSSQAPPAQAPSPQGAYGLSFTGLPPLDELVAAPVGADPGVRVSADAEPSRVPAPRPVDEQQGVRQLADGRTLALDRMNATATFHGPPIPPELVAHPYLGPVATVFSRWAGREAFHAGAFVCAAYAFAVLGPRTAGKSTLLAALSARGVPVLADDIVVTDGSSVYPGPRCLDLRERPPFDLHLRPARLDTRWRVALPPVPAAPLGGWVFLEWGSRVALERMTASEVIGRLASRRAWRTLPSDPTVLLALATLPAWTLSRPRRFDQIEPTLDALINSVQSSTAPRTMDVGVPR